MCDALVHSFKNTTWSQKHLVASLLPNHTASSRRLQAWAAFGFLVPNEFCKVTAVSANITVVTKCNFIPGHPYSSVIYTRRHSSQFSPNY